MGKSTISMAIFNEKKRLVYQRVNIAMGNGPFIDGLPIKNGDFPWLCSITRWQIEKQLADFNFKALKESSSIPPKVAARFCTSISWDLFMMFMVPMCKC